MNKIYKVIWSKAKNCYVVVSEIAKRHTKGGSRSRTERVVTAGIMAVVLTGNMGICAGAESDIVYHIVDGSMNIYAEDPYSVNMSSFADGYGKGYAIAIGSKANALGAGATAFGYNTKAAGYIHDSNGYLETENGNYITITGDYVAYLHNGKTLTVSNDNGLIGNVIQGQDGNAYTFFKEDGSTKYYKVIIADDGTASLDKDSQSYYVALKTRAADDAFKINKNDYINATAFGSDTVASNDEATAFGNGTIASGRAATSFGEKTIAEGNYSTAFGYSTRASGLQALAFGQESVASGPQSFAGGKSALASGEGSFAYGLNSKATGKHSFALGEEAKATNITAYAIGSHSEAKGENSQSFGYSAVAEGAYSTATGYGAYSKGANSYAAGWNAQALGDTSLALGYQAISNGDGVALGKWAIANTKIAQHGYLYDLASSQGLVTDETVWVPTYDDISVGDDKKTRRIANVAAGQRLTDAVNVAQLQALETRISESNSDWQLADNDGNINTAGTTPTGTAVYKPDTNNIVTLKVKNGMDATAAPRTYQIDLSSLAGGSYGWNVQTNGKDSTKTSIKNADTVNFVGDGNVTVEDLVTNSTTHTIKIKGTDKYVQAGDITNNTLNVYYDTNKTDKAFDVDLSSYDTSWELQAEGSKVNDIKNNSKVNFVSGNTETLTITGASTSGVETVTLTAIDKKTQKAKLVGDTLNFYYDLNGNTPDYNVDLSALKSDYGWNVQTTGGAVAVADTDTVKFVAGSDRITISEVASEAGVHTITIDAAAPAADKYLAGVDVDTSGNITFTMSDDSTYKLNLTSKNSSVAITGTPKTESADPSIDFSAEGGGGGSDVNIEGGDHIHVKNEGDTYTITGDETKLEDGKNTTVNSTSATDPDTGKVTTTWTVDGWKTEVEKGSDNIVVTKTTGDNDQHLKYKVDLAPDITINSATVKQQITVGGDTNQTIITGDSVKTTNVTTTEITLGEGDKTTNITYDGDRITYDNKEIANLQEDGLTFKGDTGSADVKLDKVTKIYGGATDVSSSNNITVEAKSDGSDGAELKINLAKDIKIDNSIKVGDTTNITGNTITTTNIEGDTINATTVNGDTVNTQEINLGDTTITEGDDNRITYNTKSGDTYNIATLEDGMDFAGDDGKAIHKNLAEQLDVVGGAKDKASEYNIYTYNDGGKIRINLAKDIDGVDSITVNKQINVGGDTTITGDTITTKTFTAGDTTINNDGVKIKNGPSITKNGVDAGGKKITNVAPGEDGTDAVNVDQLNDAISQVGGDAINRLGDQVNHIDNRMKKGLAGAAALAALHPLDFDPDDKLTFAAGVGNYRGENAAAVGAFYRPDEKTMLSVGGTFGNGENMVNAGISFSLDRVAHVTNSKTAMAREILDLRRELTELKASMASGNWMLDPSLTRLFPDTEENHWAYEYVKTLAGNHIIEGYPDGEFKGERMITRYEMAAILYRAMMNGAKLPDKALNEFAPELGRFRVDRVYGNGDARHKVERIRVNDENRKERDVYGSEYDYFKKNPGANVSTGALPGTRQAERAAKAEAAARNNG